MCIIAYAPKGVAIKEEIIDRMFDNNPDGAGIMWKPADDEPVRIEKGFMTLKALKKAWDKIPQDCEKAMHCRIATSGKVSTDCCHPFPVRSKIKSMKKAKDTTSMALMHNGMIDYCTPKQGMKSSYSDTMEFARRVLFPIREHLDNEAIQELIEESTTSRLLVFRKGAPTLFFGNWHESEGVWYSNDGYKPYKFNFNRNSTACWDKLYNLNGYKGSYGGCYGYGDGYECGVDDYVAPQDEEHDHGVVCYGFDIHDMDAGLKEDVTNYFDEVLSSLAFVDRLDVSETNKPDGTTVYEVYCELFGCECNDAELEYQVGYPVAYSYALGESDDEE